MSSAPPQKPAADRRADRRWEAAVDEHHESLAAYLETAGALNAEAWARPWQAGKWTPAEITEHVTLVYEAAITEATEGRALPLKLTPMHRRILRWVLLPHILFHRTLPVKARSPRECRPERPRAPQHEALRLLRETAERFESALARAHARGEGGLTHPFFGTMNAVKGLRFLAVHTEHHRKQVERAGR